MYSYLFISLFYFMIVNVWSKDPPALCLGIDPDFFAKTQAQVHHEINETCIHQHELVDRSDEKGLSQHPFAGDCPKNPAKTKDGHDHDHETHSLWNNDERLPEFDPHFPQVLTNAALYKIDTNVSLFNRAITFHLDFEEGGKRRLQKVRHTVQLMI
jgi:hypothetical protein